MSYVVFQKSDTRYAGRKNRYDDPIFESKGAATRHMNSLVKSGKFAADDLAIAESSFYHDYIEQIVIRYNLLSGAPFSERINTPHYCSPSSESYWSM